MNAQVHAYSAAGPRCSHNEDEALAQLGAAVVLGVWDGVGGRPCGEVAARLAREAFARLGPRPDPTELRTTAEAVHRRLLDESAARGLLEPMACVGTVLWLGPDGDGWMVHVGDTRAFCFEAGGGGAQLTRDHSAVYQEATPEAASLAAPRRNEIAACYGLDATPLGERLDVESVRLRPGQTVVLCTDGVSDFVDRATLARLVAGAASPAALCQAVVAAAEAGQIVAPKGDNIGIVVATFPRARRWRPAWAGATSAALAAGARVGAPLALGLALGSAVRGGERLVPPAGDLAAAAREACRGAGEACRLGREGVAFAGPWELDGEWPSVRFAGEGAALVAARGGRLAVPAGSAVTLTDLSLFDGAPREIVVGPEATLRLEGVLWRASEADVTVRLAPGSRFEIVSSDLEFGTLEVRFSGDGGGAGVDLVATRLSVSGTTPLFPAPPARASVRVGPASIVRLGEAPLFDAGTGCERAAEILAESGGGTVVAAPGEGPWRGPEVPRCPVRPGGLVWRSEDPG